MFEAWGRVVYRRRWLVLTAALAGIAIAAVWGTGVFGALKTAGGFDTPNSESQHASQLSAQAFGRDDADVVVLYRSAVRTVDDLSYRQAVSAALAALPTGDVAKTTTYWSTGAAQLVSADRRETYAVLQLTGGDQQGRRHSYNAIKNHLGAPGLTTQTGGLVATDDAVTTRVSKDIGKAEGLSIPVLLILLVVIFGSLAAASLPLAIGGVAILGSFTALRLLTLGTDVSIFSINITTILGLGLAIDYGLFMVSRFREELRHSAVPDALSATMATAGRTVAVSGVTVAVSLASLMLFPQVFLRSMGYGGVATVLVDMLAALTVMPALLAVLGPRVNSLSAASLVRRIIPGTSGRGPHHHRRPAGDVHDGPGTESSGAWYRIARSVMRRPVLYVTVTAIALIALGSPFRHITWGGVDERALPAGSQPRLVADALARDFPPNATSPIEAVLSLRGRADEPRQRLEVSAYSERLRHLPGVTSATVTGASGATVRVALGYDAAPLSVQARTIVRHVRDVRPPDGARVYVGGQSAALVDQLSSLGRTLPWMALIVGLATFVLLFLAFGSVILPIKAIVMNAASLSAAFGAVVWIFQEGNLAGLLGFTVTGTISPSMPILMLAIVFGLSMDYEVFLLSRIREQYDLTGDNTTAVATGLQRTGRVITSAALLLLVVVGAFSTSGITFIKLIGVGMIIAITVDATIVRILLVPATMRLLGRANWWAPRPMRRVYARYGIREEEREQAPVAEPVGT